jgi:hypothetical protein
MAVSGQGTTYNLPNYHGDLFVVTPQDTPFLSAIGGLGGAYRTTSVEFEWQTVDRRSSSANNSKVEGAAAPTAGERSRSNVSNVVEIHQSAVDVSYTKQAAIGQTSGINVAQSDQPVTDEVDFQVRAELESIAVDVEKSFLTGTYQKPSDNNTARQTRGILTAISTNNIAASGAVLTKDHIDQALKTAYNNGARLPQDRTVIMVSPQKKIELSALYAAATLNQPTMTRNVGGVAIDTLVTDFGVFGVMLNRHMADDTILIADLSVCHPVFLEIPGKGLLFAEPLSKTGASTKYQIYGEIGLQYGPERFHAKITGLDSDGSSSSSSSSSSS